MSPQPDPRRWKALALLCVANFMVILDAQIVILGLPSIEAELGLSADGGQWVMSAYLLSFGGLLLLGGRSADLLGRRRMFMVGTGLFSVSSLACGLAWSGGVLISARVVQGLSAAIMAPTALSILMNTFDEGAERNKALGVWSAMGGIGATALLVRRHRGRPRLDLRGRIAGDGECACSRRALRSLARTARRSCRRRRGRDQQIDGGIGGASAFREKRKRLGYRVTRRRREHEPLAP